MINGATSYKLAIGPFTSSWISEAEKKHARVAMAAVPTLLALQGVTDHPVTWLNEQSVATQVSFYAGAAVLESVNLARHDYGFSLKPGEEPGNVLNVNATKLASVTELLVGRTAMLAATCLLLQAV